jgi:predicted CopG family antitoxin
MKTTTITITVQMWKVLNSQKMPGESFDNCLRRLLGIEIEKFYDLRDIGKLKIEESYPDPVEKIIGE